LVHRFEDGEHICSGNKFEASEYIATYRLSDKTIRILDKNMKILTSMPLDPSADYSMITVSYISDDVFNSDDQIECIVQTYQVDGKTECFILNGMNQRVFEAPNASLFLIDIDGTIKMVKRASLNPTSAPFVAKLTDEIYSLPGKYRALEY